MSANHYDNTDRSGNKSDFVSAESHNLLDAPRGGKGRNKKHTASWRIRIRYVAVASIIVFLSALVIRSAFLTTIVHRQKWTDKANIELKKEVVIQPTRGDILAADGSVLATNLRYYTIRMDFQAANFKAKAFEAALDSLCDSLAKYYPQRDAAQWKSHFNSQLGKNPKDRSRSFTIVRDITHAQNEQFSTFPFFHRWSNPNKTGLTSESRMKRSYPYGDMARRSVGRTGMTDKSSEVHGISGLEYALDKKLYGKPGKAKKVPLTHNIVNWTDIAPEDGLTLRTTIDVAIQDIVENALNQTLEQTRAKWGTALLMEVKTGDIVAISNLERDTVSGRYIEAMNRALQGFEPGSVMKTISMIVALEDGFVTNLDQVYPIGGGYVFGGGSPIRDTHSPASLPVRRFLEYSSNIGMTKLVAPHYSSNPNGFRERLRQMGFLDTLGTGIAGETPPYFPPLDIKAGGLVSLGRQTYGYASRIPPLYMCAIYNAIANDGQFVRPRIVRAEIDRNGEREIPVSYVRQRICSVEHARQIREMLHEVIYGTGGTAKKLKNDYVEFAGKTGTSKIAKELTRQDRERAAELLARAKTHEDSVRAIPKAPVGYLDGHYRLAFCGFFPYEKPKYTCMVLISDPSPEFRSAATTSGYVFRDIALHMYSRGMLDNRSDFRLNPDGSSVTASRTVPQVLSGVTNQRARQLSHLLGVNRLQPIKNPPQSQPGVSRVPDVLGLSIREALTVLEKSGYKVQVSGTGFVCAQQPTAGEHAPKGRTVKLRLEH